MKKKTILILSITLFLVVLVVFINWIHIVTPSFVFSTKYYKNAEDAFIASYSPSALDINQGRVISNVDELDVILLDENNALFVGEDKENNTIVLATMYVKNNKYLRTTSIFVYTDSDICDFSEGALQRIDLYGSNGKAKDNGYFSLCRNSIDNEKYYSEKINSSLEIYLVIQK